MKRLLFPMTVSIVLICAVNCNSPKSDSSNHVDIESVYKQNLKDSTLATGWYYILENETGFKRQLYQTEKYYFIDPEPILVKDNFQKVKIAPDFHQERYFIAISTYKKYYDRWAEATEKSIGKQIGFIVDDQLITAPMVNMKITDGQSSISGYDKKVLEAFKKRIEK